MKIFLFVFLFLAIMIENANSLENTKGKTPEYKEINKIYAKNVAEFAKTKKIPENAISDDYLKIMNSGDVFEFKSTNNTVQENEESKRFFDLLK